MATYVVVHDEKLPYGEHEYSPGEQFDGKDWVKSDLDAALATGLIKEVEAEKVVKPSPGKYASKQEEKDGEKYS